ncbi:MAG: hypothetical protein Tsb005_08050 [Gammaproteobacteria bacterium]
MAIDDFQKIKNKFSPSKHLQTKHDRLLWRERRKHQKDHALIREEFGEWVFKQMALPQSPTIPEGKLLLEFIEDIEQQISLKYPGFTLQQALNTEFSQRNEAELLAFADYKAAKEAYDAAVVECTLDPTKELTAQAKENPQIRASLASLQRIWYRYWMTAEVLRATQQHYQHQVTSTLVADPSQQTGTLLHGKGSAGLLVDYLAILQDPVLRRSSESSYILSVEASNSINPAFSEEQYKLSDNYQLIPSGQVLYERFSALVKHYETQQHLSDIHRAIMHKSKQWMELYDNVRTEQQRLLREVNNAQRVVKTINVLGIKYQEYLAPVEKPILHYVETQRKSNPHYKFDDDNSQQAQELKTAYDNHYAKQRDVLDHYKKQYQKRDDAIANVKQAQQKLLNAMTQHEQRLHDALYQCQVQIVTQCLLPEEGGANTLAKADIAVAPWVSADDIVVVDNLQQALTHDKPYVFYVRNNEIWLHSPVFKGRIDNDTWPYSDRLGFLYAIEKGYTETLADYLNKYFHPLEEKFFEEYCPEYDLTDPNLAEDIKLLINQPIFYRDVVSQQLEKTQNYRKLVTEADTSALLPKIFPDEQAKADFYVSLAPTLRDNNLDQFTQFFSQRILSALKPDEQLQVAQELKSTVVDWMSNPLLLEEQAIKIRMEQIIIEDAQVYNVHLTPQELDNQVKQELTRLRHVDNEVELNEFKNIKNLTPAYISMLENKLLDVFQSKQSALKNEMPFIQQAVKLMTLATLGETSQIQNYWDQFAVNPDAYPPKNQVDYTLLKKLSDLQLVVFEINHHLHSLLASDELITAAKLQEWNASREEILEKINKELKQDDSTILIQANTVGFLQNLKSLLTLMPTLLGNDSQSLSAEQKNYILNYTNQISGQLLNGIWQTKTSEHAPPLIKQKQHVNLQTQYENARNALVSGPSVLSTLTPTKDKNLVTQAKEEVAYQWIEQHKHIRGKESEIRSAAYAETVELWPELAQHSIDPTAPTVVPGTLQPAHDIVQAVGVQPALETVLDARLDAVLEQNKNQQRTLQQVWEARYNQAESGVQAMQRAIQTGSLDPLRSDEPDQGNALKAAYAQVEEQLQQSGLGIVSPAYVYQQQQINTQLQAHKSQAEREYTQAKQYAASVEQARREWEKMELVIVIKGQGRISFDALAKMGFEVIEHPQQGFDEIKPQLETYLKQQDEATLEQRCPKQYFPDEGGNEHPQRIQFRDYLAKQREQILNDIADNRPVANDYSFRNPTTGNNIDFKALPGNQWIVRLKVPTDKLGNPLITTNYVEYDPYKKHPKSKVSQATQKKLAGITPDTQLAMLALFHQVMAQGDKLRHVHVLGANEVLGMELHKMSRMLAWYYPDEPIIEIRDFHLSARQTKDLEQWTHKMHDKARQLRFNEAQWQTYRDQIDILAPKVDQLIGNSNLDPNLKTQLIEAYNQVVNIIQQEPVMLEKPRQKPMATTLKGQVLNVLRGPDFLQGHEEASAQDRHIMNLLSDPDTMKIKTIQPKHNEALLKLKELCTKLEVELKESGQDDNLPAPKPF